MSYGVTYWASLQNVMTFQHCERYYSQLLWIHLSHVPQFIFTQSSKVIILSNILYFPSDLSVALRPKAIGLYRRCLKNVSENLVVFSGHYTNQRKLCFCWGLFSTPDLSTFGTEETFQVEINLNYSKCIQMCNQRHNSIYGTEWTTMSRNAAVWLKDVFPIEFRD